MRLLSHVSSFTQPAAHSAILTGRTACHLRPLDDYTLYYSASSQYLFCKTRASHNSLELEQSSQLLLRLLIDAMRFSFYFLGQSAYPKQMYFAYLLWREGAIR